MQIQNFLNRAWLAEMTPEQHFREGTVHFQRGVASAGARSGRVHLAVILFIVSSVTGYLGNKTPDYFGQKKKKKKKKKKEGEKQRNNYEHGSLFQGHILF